MVTNGLYCSQVALKFLALPLDDVDIELKLRNHLFPDIRVPHHVSNMAAVLLDLLQQPGVDVSVLGHLTVETLDDLASLLTLPEIPQHLDGAGEAEHLLLLALQQTVDTVDVLQQQVD